jgi:parallel beta-helix repeat protein
MPLNELWQHWIGRSRTGRRPRPQAAPRRSVRLSLERLEDRHLPSSYTAATVSDLIADINAANLAGGSNTIALAAGTTFSLTAADNTTDGATGLPVIAANDNLSIAGNGDTIERNNNSKTNNFRLFDVAAGAALTLANLTLQGGLAYGFVGGAETAGGAIFNQGSLALNGVTVQNNIAQGSSAAGGAICSSGSLTLQGCTVQNNQALGNNPPYYQESAAFGGGICSSGSLTLQDCTVQNNQALGSNGFSTGVPGFAALGGGLYVSGGTASLTNVTLYSNTARGGDGANGGTVDLCGRTGCSKFHVGGGSGGDGLGGGMYVAGGTVSVDNTTVDQNSAVGGTGGSSPKGFAQGSAGLGEGGGIYIAAAASVCLDAFTLAHVTQNAPDNVFGSYTIC